MSTTRNARRTHFLFATDTATHADTCHGNTVGAWAKMWARTMVGLFGEAAEDWTLADATDSAALVVRNRRTDETLTLRVVSGQRL
jgi:purine nucleoside permease